MQFPAFRSHRLASIVIGVLSICVINGAESPKTADSAETKKSAVSTDSKASPEKETVDQQFAKRIARLWSLQPIKRPAVPTAVSTSENPIDSFIAAAHKQKGLHATGAADKATLLRRVYLDLIGLPPTPDEQRAFLDDPSPDAYEKVIDRLLSDRQHGVRWARHWLDVLRYADLDAVDGSIMPAAPGIYLWREWMISALNRDMPYDEFVRAQILGNRSRNSTNVNVFGQRLKTQSGLEDQFALGFLARGATSKSNADHELGLAAVETISTAFMGMTVGCAKCHDHMFDPIKQTDYYAMKALFDPLVLRKVVLATPGEIFENGKRVDEYNQKRAPIDAAIEKLIAPYRIKLYDERVSMLTPDVQAIIRKTPKQRTQAEQKIADDYFPVLRIDPSKIKEIMPPEQVTEYTKLLEQVNALGRSPELPAYWTVEEDSAQLKETSYVLNTGDPKRPEKDKPVEPGFPFKPEGLDFRDGRREGFVDWLTAPENPLFARVAVNRLWQWHFGEGLHRVSSDFGLLGGRPSNQQLLDYLTAEFVAHDYSMKWLHRLILTSDTYKMASKPDPQFLAANIKADPNNTYLWRFRLQRLEAEPIWDSLLYGSGDLDLTVGGKSFQPKQSDKKQAIFVPRNESFDPRTNRRAAYMARGYIPSTDVMANFLPAFDVDDGRTPCPIRTRTVTAPQSLFTMNDDLVNGQSVKVAQKLLKDSSGDMRKAVELAYQTTLSRLPTAIEADQAQTYVEGQPDRLKGLIWLLFNLDEFIFVR